MPRSPRIDAIHAQRRLAAIVVADVVGYTRLMEQDESGAHGRLKALREQLIDPKIAAHGGRIVKTAGDGLLLEFGSATAALRCAIDVQRAMAARNRDLAPDARIELRIGINLGDIIVDGEDVAGDGVNIAARLETLAEPGGICIAAAVRDQVREDLDAAFVDIGVQQVKNIARPIHVFRVAIEKGAAGLHVARHASTSARSSRWRWLTAGVVVVAVVGVIAWQLQSTRSTMTSSTTSAPVRSIAVMPFTFSGSAAADSTLADSLTRDVTAALARTGGELVVASQGLAATYKGKPVDARAVGRELNVRYLAEGDVRRVGDQVSVTVQLVDAVRGAQVWTEHVEFQTGRPGGDEVSMTRRLTWKLSVALNGVVARQLGSAPPGKSAQELVERAWLSPSSTDLRAAREAARLLDEVLQREPNFVPALTARYWMAFYEFELDSRSDRDRLVRKMDEVSSRAIELEDDPQGWLTRSLVLGMQGRLDAALEANARARQLDPSNRTVFDWRAWTLILKGQPDEALDALEKTKAVFPDDYPGTLRLACMAHLYLGQYARAVDLCERSSGLQNWYWDQLLLAAAYANTGDAVKAAAARTELLKLVPGYSIGVFKARRYSEHPVFVELSEAHLLTGLRKAGVPER